MHLLNPTIKAKSLVQVAFSLISCLCAHLVDPASGPSLLSTFHYLQQPLSSFLPIRRPWEASRLGIPSIESAGSCGQTSQALERDSGHLALHYYHLLRGLLCISSGLHNACNSLLKCCLHGVIGWAASPSSVILLFGKCSSIISRNTMGGVTISFTSVSRITSTNLGSNNLERSMALAYSSCFDAAAVQYGSCCAFGSCQSMTQ